MIDKKRIFKNSWCLVVFLTFGEKKKSKEFQQLECAVFLHEMEKNIVLVFRTYKLYIHVYMCALDYRVFFQNQKEPSKIGLWRKFEEKTPITLNISMCIT